MENFDDSKESRKYEVGVWAPRITLMLVKLSMPFIKSISFSFAYTTTSANKTLSAWNIRCVVKQSSHVA